MISIFIPFYNEEKRLANSLEVVYSYLSSKFPPDQFELLLVNDGSRDRSLEIARSFLEEHPGVRLVSHEPPNLGKGHAVRAGMLAAKGDWVCFLDTDLATPMEELEKFMPYFKDYEVVIGTRRVKEAKIEIHQPLHRELMGKVFYYLTRLILGLKVTDVTCGFKCYSRLAAETIFPRQILNDWSYDAENLFLAQKFGFKIKDVPVTWQDKDQSRVRVIKDGLDALKGLLKIRLNDIRGAYKENGSFKDPLLS